MGLESVCARSVTGPISVPSLHSSIIGTRSKPKITVPQPCIPKGSLCKRQRLRLPQLRGITVYCLCILLMIALCRTGSALTNRSDQPHHPPSDGFTSAKSQFTLFSLRSRRCCISSVGWCGYHVIYFPHNLNLCDTPRATNNFFILQFNPNSVRTARFVRTAKSIGTKSLSTAESVSTATTVE